MLYLVVAICLFLLTGYCLKIVINKLEMPDKRCVSLLLAITLILIGVVCLRWYIEDFQNDVITHYQNGDYHIVKRPNGDITYKIIPTDYD